MDEEAARYGVAHTPTAIVDFTVKSAIGLLLRHGIEKDGISALDPFTGDGVFLDSLMRHGVSFPTGYEIRTEQMLATRKRFGGSAEIFRADAFETTPRGFNLIIGNPPYGKCTRSAAVDARIRETYGGCATNESALYDGYVRAVRWATDNIESGVIAYVLNSGFLDGNSFANFRKCLEREFSEVYVVNLRGNHRTSGEQCRREGGNVFGQEARVGIAILLLLKPGGKNGRTRRGGRRADKQDVGRQENLFR